ncbi:MAG: hypothetical protein HUK14_01560 [Muribaculaceae bacterium]|nr:hypothetical protein [Muribaculaceae bacterium]
MKTFISIICSFILLFVPAQVMSQTTEKYELEMAEIGKPGVLVVKVWCYSKKANIAEDLFRKCAIKGVLFEGVNDSGRMKGRKPLVLEGYDNHKDYFNLFFENREYNKYTRMALNGYVEQNSIIKIKKLYKVGKIVVISFNELRTRLETDEIIKSLNSGF